MSIGTVSASSGATNNDGITKPAAAPKGLAAAAIVVAITLYLFVITNL